MTNASDTQHSDNPEWTAADVRKARRLADMPAEFQAAIRKARGPQKRPTKVPVTIRLSAKVVEHYKASGTGWQARIDADLSKLIEAP